MGVCLLFPGVSLLPEKLKGGQACWDTGTVSPGQAAPSKGVSLSWIVEELGPLYHGRPDSMLAK